MTEEDIRRVNKERLDAWAEVLAGVHATGAVLIGIGHDDVSGQIHICQCANTKPEFLRLLLKGVLESLEAGWLPQI